MADKTRTMDLWREYLDEVKASRGSPSSDEKLVAAILVLAQRVSEKEKRESD